MKKYNYDEAVSYIMEIPRFLTKNTMDDTKRFLGVIGEPGESQKVFHVAGTNGKGSTCAFIDSVCMAMGKKTGRFTSPHLVDIRERITINGRMISKEDFLESFNYVKDKIEAYDKSDYHPSFFEYLFFMAVYIFNKNDVEVGIYETGLGGRLDATSSLTRYDSTVITTIAMDHMEYLGDTMEQIAMEKAGIMRSGVRVIFADGKEYTRPLEEHALKVGAICDKVKTCPMSDVLSNEKDIDFCYDSRYYSSVNLTCHTSAIYQAMNAALALRALEGVFEEELKPEIMQKGIASMKWPGRMEQVLDDVFLDGGHNVEGVGAFLECVKKDTVKGRRFLIYSGVSDKQTDKIGRMIKESDLFYKIAVCEIDSYRATSVQALMNAIDTAVGYDNLHDSYENIRHEMKKDDRLYICGSLYLVGEAKSMLGEIRS